MCQQNVLSVCTWIIEVARIKSHDVDLNECKRHCRVLRMWHKTMIWLTSHLLFASRTCVVFGAPWDIWSSSQPWGWELAALHKAEWSNALPEQSAQRPALLKRNDSHCFGFYILNQGCIISRYWCGSRPLFTPSKFLFYTFARCRGYHAFHLTLTNLFSHLISNVWGTALHFSAMVHYLFMGKGRAETI